MHVFIITVLHYPNYQDKYMLWLVLCIDQVFHGLSYCTATHLNSFHMPSCYISPVQKKTFIVETRIGPKLCWFSMMKIYYSYLKPCRPFYLWQSHYTFTGIFCWSILCSYSTRIVLITL